MHPAPLVALVGNPNAGKSALFNALTGARQKVGNYPGVTVERHAGRMTLPDGRPVELLDLPGTYSLEPSSPDERVTRDVVTGAQAGERLPDAIIVVVDASNLDNHLRFTLQLIALGLPIVVALNMIDLAERDGLKLDPAALERELGVPVIPTVAVRKRGIDALKDALDTLVTPGAVALRRSDATLHADIATLQRRARQIAVAATDLGDTGPPLDAHVRRGRAASGVRRDAVADDPVRDVPGGVLRGRRAGRCDRRRVRLAEGPSDRGDARRRHPLADHRRRSSRASAR